MTDDLLYRDDVYKIVGACIAVHKDKGNGFTEPVYQDALEIELELSGIPFDRQRNYSIMYRGRTLKHTYTPDLLCLDKDHRRIEGGKSAHRRTSSPIAQLPQSHRPSARPFD